MTKLKKSIINVNVGVLSHSMHLNKALNNDNFKSVFLTLYPYFKINNDFKKNNTVISKSFFFNFIFFFIQTREI